MRSVVAETIDIVIEKSQGTLEKISVDDLVIGVFFTGVKLSTGQAGVAFTRVGKMPEAGCAPHPSAQKKGKPAGIRLAGLRYFMFLYAKYASMNVGKPVVWMRSRRACLISSSVAPASLALRM
jgi:hypothetical protein